MSKIKVFESIEEIKSLNFEDSVTNPLDVTALRLDQFTFNPANSLADRAEAFRIHHKELMGGDRLEEWSDERVIEHFMSCNDEYDSFEDFEAEFKSKFA